MTDEDDFVAVFREDASGRLETIDGVLVDVESGRGGAGAVDALFREFHTIKGAAGMVGLDDAHALADAVEDLLSAVRAAGAPVAGVADALLRAADELRAQLAGHAAAPSAALLDELAERRAALEPGAPEPAPVPAAAQAAEPARTIRVPAGKLDRVLQLVGETVVHRRRLEHTLGLERLGAAHELADELSHGDRLLDDLQLATLTLRTVPLRSIAGPFPRAVRDIAVAEGKEAELEIAGADTELDRVILERLAEPLVHLLRNAVHHGIEPPAERERAGKPRRGHVELRAEQRGALVAVSVRDDGRGVAEEVVARAGQGVGLAEALARAGFSTAEAVTAVAGRGVGLDAVKREVESLGGRLEVFSRPGAGSEVALLLPLTLALLDVLLVERGGHAFALPLASVLEVVHADAPLELAGRRSLDVRGEAVPLADLAGVVGAAAPPPAARSPAPVVAAAIGRVALLCDAVLGEEEVAVSPLGPLLARVPGYLGAAILGDGRVALIVDPGALDRVPEAPARPDEPAPAGDARHAPVVLVVEDSLTVRALQRSILESAGYRVETASDGAEALDRLRRDSAIDLVVTDVDMPRMDGFALVAAIRADPERAGLPVVVVTSRASEADRRRGLEAGADAYLEKGSFDQRALLDAAERLVGG